MHINKPGWHDWSNQEAQKNAYYAEYGNSGPGYQPDSRVTWSKQLTKKEASKITESNVFGTNSSEDSEKWWLRNGK